MLLVMPLPSPSRFGVSGMESCHGCVLQSAVGAGIHPPLLFAQAVHPALAVGAQGHCGFLPRAGDAEPVLSFPCSGTLQKCC